MGKDLKGKELGTGITQRKDGRYEARALIKGKRIDIYSNNLQELKREFRKQKEAAIREDVLVGEKVTVSQWFEEWFETCKRPQLKNTAATVNYRRKFINRYGSILGDMRLRDVRQLHIQRATNELIQKGYNVRNVADALCVLRQCYDTAVANRMVLVNPCIGVLLPRHSVVSERRVLAHWEQKLLLEVVSGRFYKEVYHICLLTGMRVGELGALEWKDIDFTKKEIHVHRSLSISYDKGKHIEITTPKTSNSNRVIPFFDNIADYFMDWRQKQDEAKHHMGNRWRNTEYGDLVFTTTLGSPLTKFTFQHDINKVVEEMRAQEAYHAMREGREPREINNLYPHAFRHTFATRCNENEMSPLFIQKVMGHSNYATTLSYTHLLDEAREKEIKKSKNFLNPS